MHLKLASAVTIPAFDRKLSSKYSGRKETLQESFGEVPKPTREGARAPQSVESALQSCKFIAACEDLFLTANQHELTRIKRARTPFKKQSYASRFKRTIS